MTVGPGVSPDLLTFAESAGKALAGFPIRFRVTAGGEFHPALRIEKVILQAIGDVN